MMRRVEVNGEVIHKPHNLTKRVFEFQWCRIIEYRNKNKQLHRLDGPAYISLGGYKEWRIKGKLHRLDGPAIEKTNGDKEWWVKGKHHRLDGPAIEHSNGYKAWYTNGKRHRLDGPAVEYANGGNNWFVYYREMTGMTEYTKKLQQLNAFLKFTLLQNKSRKFNEWLFDPDHYAGKWHKKNMLRDFQVE